MALSRADNPLTTNYTMYLSFLGGGECLCSIIKEGITLYVHMHGYCFVWLPVYL